MRSTENPGGALLLSVVAVSHFPQIYLVQYLTSLGHWQSEQALKQYEVTGEIVPSSRKHDNHFSEEMWITPALQYKNAIQKLSDKSWELIIDGAWKIAQTKKAGHATGTSSNNLDVLPVEDERGLLAEGDEDIEDDEIEWEAQAQGYESCEY